MNRMTEQQFRLVLGGGLVVAVVGLIGGFLWQNHQTLALTKPEVIQTDGHKLALNTLADFSSSAVLGETTTEGSVANSDLYYVNPFGDGQQVPLANYQVSDTQAIYNLINGGNQSQAGKRYLRGFVYPMNEFGGCRNQQDCYQYCEVASHVTACSSLAVANGMMAARPTVLGASDNPASAANAAYANDLANYQLVSNDPTAYYSPELKQLLANQSGTSGNFSGLPRVLSASDGLSGYALGGSSVGGVNNIRSCTQEPPTSVNPDTGEVTQLPIPDSTKQACQQEIFQFANNQQQQVASGVAQAQQQSQSNLMNLSSCFAASRDFVSDLQYCLAQVNY